MEEGYWVEGFGLWVFVSGGALEGERGKGGSERGAYEAEHFGFWLR